MLTATQIAPSIVRVQAETQHELSETFLRFQEHYESPEWRGKVFTVGQFRAWYSEKYGVNTYERDWAGYNFPSYVLAPFIQGLFDPLTPGEQDLVNLFRFRTDKFYIIGAQDQEVLDHEECHALYHVNEKYRKEVDKVLTKCAWDISSVEKTIRRMMYHPSVVMDEVHAYTSSADREWFKSNSLTFPDKVHKELRAIKRRHFKRGKPDGT